MRTELFLKGRLRHDLRAEEKAALIEAGKATAFDPHGAEQAEAAE